ncbi:Hypothetical protein D9617_11g009090 [Elsinoe fawcettii]|nr:Hypothetical protein D9617_11g009090 [Elsinoe fawcettii]
MKSIAFVAAAALPFTAALKQSSSGGARVVNKCNYEIPLKSIPAMGTGVQNGQTSEKTLAANGKGDNEFFTPWIQLLVAGGWSIKLNTIGSWTNIMQFEYTWAADNQLWYDNSFVDGVESEHPKWAFDCPLCPEKPHNLAYQHSTDDAAGMQKPCSTDATVTLILCPENGDAGSSNSSPAPAPAPSSSAQPTTEAPAPTTTTTPPPPSTTFATSTSSSLPIKQANVPDAPAEDDSKNQPGSPVIVTAIEYKVVTALVYETEAAQARKKRHAHRHPHGHA